MSDQIKHECGIALIRLLQPLQHYQEKYGTALHGLYTMQLLLQKMRNRGQDSEAVIAQRLAAAREEMSHYGEFDYVIVNEVFETAVDEMCAIFTASRLRREPQVARHQGLISALLVEDRAVPSG